MVPKITKKLDSKNPDHLMAVIEEFRDEIRVVNEMNQTMGRVVNRLDSLENTTEKLVQEQKITNARLGTLEERMDHVESSLKTLRQLFSEVDLIELQERVVKIEKKLEMR